MPETLSRDDLNRAVALALGWEWRDTDGGGYWAVNGGIDQAPPFGRSDGVHRADFWELPDFAADPHALGYMFEWLDAKKVASEIQNVERLYLPSRKSRMAPNRWRVLIGNFHNFYAPTLGEALARAIVAYAAAMKENDRE